MSRAMTSRHLRHILPGLALLVSGTATAMEPMRTFAHALEELSCLGTSDVHARPGSSQGADVSWPERIDARLAGLAHEATTPKPSEGPVAPHAALHSRLQSLLSKVPPRVVVGVSVRDLDSGQEVFDWQAERDLNP